MIEPIELFEHQEWPSTDVEKIISRKIELNESDEPEVWHVPAAERPLRKSSKAGKKSTSSKTQKKVQLNEETQKDNSCIFPRFSFFGSYICKCWVSNFFYF